MSKKKRYTTLLVADNKDIYDLLKSESVFKKPVLREIALQRGIILSSHDTTEDLVKYMSLLSYDGPQLDDLLARAVPPERHAPSTIRQYEVESTADELFANADAIKQLRAKTENEDVRVTKSGDAVVVKISYSQLDPSRTRLSQPRLKEAVVEFENKDGVLQVRSTPGAKSSAFVDEVVAMFATGEDEPAPPKQIDLSGLREPQARTKFFLGLLDNMKAYPRTEVTDVRVHRLDHSGDGDSDDDEDPPKKHKFPKADAALKSQLTNATFQGSNLLTTKVYQDLNNEGYFISRLVWTATAKTATTEASFEAWFHEAADARDFRYRVRTVAQADDKGKLGTHQTPEDTVRRTLLAAVESAARASLDTIEAEYAAPKPKGKGGKPKKKGTSTAGAK